MYNIQSDIFFFSVEGSSHSPSETPTPGTETPTPDTETPTPDTETTEEPPNIRGWVFACASIVLLSGGVATVLCLCYQRKKISSRGTLENATYTNCNNEQNGMVPSSDVSTLTESQELQIQITKINNDYDEQSRDGRPIVSEPLQNGEVTSKMRQDEGFQYRNPTVIDNSYDEPYNSKGTLKTVGTLTIFEGQV